MKHVLTNRKSVLWALLFAIGGMLFASSAAQAFEPAAPVFTETPANPNVTKEFVTFKFQEPAATSTETLASSQECRHYATGNPPAPGAGWIACTIGPDSNNVVVGDFTFDRLPGAGGHGRQGFVLANGNWTFEVRQVYKDSSVPPNVVLTNGPSATYSWTQNIPAPSAAPVFASKPSDPQTTPSPSPPFAFAPGEGDEDLVNRFESVSYTHLTLPTIYSV